MATISYIIQAINRASSVFNDVADSAAKLAAAEDAATVATLNYNRATALQIGAVNRAASALRDLRTAALGAAAAQAAAGTSTAASGAAAAAATGRWLGLLRVFTNTNKVPLFGGIGPSFLSQIAGWHLAVDLVAEFLAVALPATIALIGFGAVAGPIFSDISTRLQEINAVSQATKQNIYPITGQLRQLQNAIKPQVYQLFGEGLNLISNNSQKVIQPLRSLGNVLDQLAARAEVALSSGGFSYFMRNAVKDVQQFGDVIANVFGTLGNIFRQFPGYANIILTALDNVTKGAERLSASPLVASLINIGLWAHGAVIYIGLLATGIAKLVPWLLGGLATGLAKGAGLLGNFGSLGAKAGVQLAGLSIFAERAGKLPWGWIAVAAAGLGFLIYRLATAKDAFGRFIDNMNASLARTGAADGIRNINNALQSLNAQLKITGTLLPATPGALGVPGVPARVIPPGGLGPPTPAGPVYGRFGPLGPAITPNQPGAGTQQAIQDAKQYRDELKRLQDQLTTYNQHVGALVPTYGSVAAVQRALAISGVSLDDFTSKNANTWARAQAQISATANAYKALGASSVEASNDVQVVARAASDQTQAIQQLNSAWDSYISALTGSANAFDTWALAFGGPGTGGQPGTGLIGAVQTAGATIDGLNTQSLQLNQAFTQQVQQSGTLIDAWRTAGITGNALKAGVKGIVAELIPFAGNSKEALAMLTGLADEAGYQGIPNLKGLTDWLGNTSGAMQAVQSTTQQATIQMGLLTTAMQGQGQFIANQLLGDINTAIGSYNGVYQAATNYGNALAQYGKDSAQAKGAADDLALAIVKGGVAAGDSQGQIASLISQVLQIPLNTALQIVVQDEQALTEAEKIKAAVENVPTYWQTQFHAYLSGSAVALQMLAGGTATGIMTKHPGAAAGAYVTQGTTPTADNVLAMVSRGELIVPAHLVAAGMVDHLRGMIPGFAGGGTPADLRAGSMASQPGLVLISSESGSARTPEARTEKLLAKIAALLDELVDVTNAAPGQTAAAITGSNGGRSAAYHAMYSTRG